MNDSLEIPGFLDRRPLIWSFTMLNTYREICPHQAAERFVYKRIPFVETPQMKWGNEVHTAMEQRVKQQRPLPVNMPYEHFAKAFDGRKVHPEMKLGVTREGRTTGFFDKDVWGRGKLDVPVVEGDQAFIADYKTGKVREHPFELEVQAVLLKAKFPHLRKIVGRYIWLADQKLGHLYDLTDTQKTWDEIQWLYAGMLANMQKEQWEKREGPLCRYCAVLDCENWRPRQ